MTAKGEIKGQGIKNGNDYYTQLRYSIAEKLMADSGKPGQMTPAIGKETDRLLAEKVREAMSLSENEKIPPVEAMKRVTDAAMKEAEKAVGPKKDPNIEKINELRAAVFPPDRAISFASEADGSIKFTSKSSTGESYIYLTEAEAIDALAILNAEVVGKKGMYEGQQARNLEKTSAVLKEAQKAAGFKKDPNVEKITALRAAVFPPEHSISFSSDGPGKVKFTSKSSTGESYIYMTEAEARAALDIVRQEIVGKKGMYEGKQLEKLEKIEGVLNEADKKLNDPMKLSQTKSPEEYAKYMAKASEDPAKPTGVLVEGFTPSTGARGDAKTTEAGRFA
jgi:hypothetical protein